RPPEALRGQETKGGTGPLLLNLPKLGQSRFVSRSSTCQNRTGPAAPTPDLGSSKLGSSKLDQSRCSNLALSAGWQSEASVRAPVKTSCVPVSAPAAGAIMLGIDQDHVAGPTGQGVAQVVEGASHQPIARGAMAAAWTGTAPVISALAADLGLGQVLDAGDARGRVGIRRVLAL